jgi:hypothetical protein
MGSTGGFAVFLGSNIISWTATKQDMVLLTPKFGKESDLWVQRDEESVRRKEGFFRCNRQKNPRSAICFRSARQQLS